MKAFREQAADDLGVFLNMDEFAEEHDLNGTVTIAIVQSPTSKERFSGTARSYDVYDGVTGTDVVVYCRANALPEIPVEGQRFTLDGEIYLVSQCVDEMGVLSITLQGESIR